MLTKALIYVKAIRFLPSVIVWDRFLLIYETCTIHEYNRDYLVSQVKKVIVSCDNLNTKLNKELNLEKKNTTCMQ